MIGFRVVCRQRRCRAREMEELPIFGMFRLSRKDNGGKDGAALSET